jgi:hypothetical protein
LSAIAIPPEVIAAPLSCAPRQAYAATCGDPVFAAFVRRSIDDLSRRRVALARGWLSQAEENELSARSLEVHQIVHRHGARWFPAPAGFRLAFGRGFPEWVTGVDMNATDRWLDAHARLRQTFPLVGLQLHGAAGRCAALGSTLEGIVALSLAGNRLVDADVAALFAQPAARGLVWLGLAGNELTMASLETLMAHAPALRRLHFRGNRIADPTYEWQDHDGALVLTAGTGAGELAARLGPRPWLEPPPYCTLFQSPELYYPIPDLDEPPRS